MRVSRLFAAWLAEGIAAAASPIPTLCAAAVDGDEVAPDRITLVVSEEIDPIAPPLHIYDVLIEIRTPAASAITSAQHASADAWLDGYLAAAGSLAAIATDLAGIGNLNDWFVGKAGRAVRYENAIVSERTVRLALVHS